MLGQCACQPSTKARQGRTTSVLQQTSCFLQFLSRLAQGAWKHAPVILLPRCTALLWAQPPKISDEPKHTHVVSTAHISNRTVNTYIYINNSAICKTLLSLTNCLLNAKTSKPEHNFNIKILTSIKQGKDTHFIVVPLGPTSFERHYARKA